MNLPRRTARRLRRGFTMIELMVAIVMLTLVVGGLLGVVMGQQRFYDSASEVMEVRDNLRRIGVLLPSEMRALAPLEGDIYEMTDSMLDFRVPIGTAIVCMVSSSWFTIPPLALSTDAGLTSWNTPPIQGDSIAIFDSRDSLMDTTIYRQINATPSAGTCPTTSGFTSTVAEAAAALTLNVSPALSSTVRAGSPIRFWRRARYSLYQAPDRKWYLGFRDYVPNRNPAWSNIQPVAGPLMPYAASGQTGLRFTYRDSIGAALTAIADAPRVRRIDIEVRAQSSVPVRTAGFNRNAAGYYVDSLLAVVAVRNH